MKYATQKVAYWLFRRRHGLFVVQVLVGALAGDRLRRAELPGRDAALQHPAHDPHQRADRLAAAGLLRRGLLPDPGGGRARASRARCWPMSSSALLMVGALAAVSATCSASTRGASSSSSRSGSRSASSSVALIFLYNISHDGAEGPQDRDHQRPAAGPVGHRGLLPVRLLQPGEPRGRQAVLVVRRPPLGRGRLGAGDGLGPRLPGHQDDRRRPRGGREVALRHRRPGAVLRPARHRPPLLLDRRSGLLAVDRHRSSRRSRSLPSSPW